MNTPFLGLGWGMKWGSESEEDKAAEMNRGGKKLFHSRGI